MSDPAVAFRDARHDLSKLHRIIDHLLKEICELEPKSPDRRLRIELLSALYAHRDRLRREEDAAWKRLREEAFPRTAIDLSDPSPGELEEFLSPEGQAREEASKQEHEAHAALKASMLQQLIKTAGMRSLSRCTLVSER